MMDFKIAVSNRALEQVLAGLRGIGQLSGAVLRSGRSYHYYGFEAFDREAWLQFLAQSLLLDGMTDTRYIAHRMLSRQCVLRITASALKAEEPTVVAILG